MKIRRGFVSNSSSSSFIVAFPRKPVDVEDLKEMMFGKQEWHYSSIGEDDVPTLLIARKVFDRMGEPATSEEVFESIRGGWFDSYLIPESYPGYASYYNDPEYKAIDNRLLGVPKEKQRVLRLDMQREIWGKYIEINDKRAKNIADAFCGVSKDNYIVVLRFSDNDGEAVEEHTDIFRRLEHIRTSYH